jgi:hypothetical protein
MTNVQDTTHAHNDNLADLSPEAARLVLRVIKRMSDDRGLMLPERVHTNDGIGLIAADAMFQAVRHVGAWLVIDHVRAFLVPFAHGRPAICDTAWAWETIAAIRSDEFGILNQEWGSAAVAHETLEQEILLHEESSDWVAACAANLCCLALWAAWTSRADARLPQETLDDAAQAAGLGIADVLFANCGKAAAWEFVRSVRAIRERLAA